MIVYNNNYDFKKQLEKNYEELQGLKMIYKKRIKLFEMLNDATNNSKSNDIKSNMFSSEKNVCNYRIEKIEELLKRINELEKNIEMPKVEKIEKYNKDYEKIKNNYLNDALTDDETIIENFNKILFDYKKNIEENNVEEAVLLEKSDNNVENIQEFENGNDKVYNNDTLVISETEGIVKLPYRAEEVKAILKEEPNKYTDENDVIQNVFTRKISEYKLQFASRYNETLKLAREREKYNIVDAISLAIEMMKKRFLHPAIISACRSVDDLDVYLDCLDKNEIDDFKIFKIKYEVHPMIVKGGKREQSR